jgi:hypothetical protein
MYCTPTVNTLLEKEKKSSEENPLQNIVTNLGIDAVRGTSGATPSDQGQIRNTGTINTVNIGVPSKEVGHIDLVNPDIRKQILKGDNINLGAIVIPAYETQLPTKQTSASLEISALANL